MKLREFKEILANNKNKRFLIQLPNQKNIPQSFHITEVGLIKKEFIDCGGSIHKTEACQLQAWIGADVDHKIETEKMLSILKKSESIINDDSINLEIEYEDNIISQYPVSQAIVTDDAVTLELSLKHTDCLAKEQCLPKSSDQVGCCGNSTGCC